MKRTVRNATLMLSRIDQRHIRLAVALVSLALLVIGAGAPGDWGGG